MNAPSNRRVLVVDDMPSIHDDFRKILTTTMDPVRAAQEAILFGMPPPVEPVCYVLDSAFQGEEALAKVEDSVRACRHYALAIVDMRMPPGWNGIETIQHLWRADADLQILLCSAYSEATSTGDLLLTASGDKLSVLRKPFDPAGAIGLIDQIAARRERNQG